MDGPHVSYLIGWAFALAFSVERLIHYRTPRAFAWAGYFFGMILSGVVGLVGLQLRTPDRILVIAAMILCAVAGWVTLRGRKTAHQ